MAGGAARWLRHPYRSWRASRAGHMWLQGGELELLQRSMGFAALGLVTLVPLLIVVAAAVPFHGYGFAQWLVDGMGLSAEPAQAVKDVFATPGAVISSTSGLSLLALALFGLSFAACVEVGYTRIWQVPPTPWHHVWRRAVWLAALTAYLFAEAQSGAVLGEGWPDTVFRGGTAVVLGFAFFWWGQYFLLAGKVPWPALVPGALVTMAGLIGLRVFSSYVFAPLIVTNAVSYGAVGTVLIVQCWLIGVGFVVFGGALLGRHLQNPGTWFPSTPSGQAEGSAERLPEGEPHGCREEGREHRPEDEGQGRGGRGETDRR